MINNEDDEANEIIRRLSKTREEILYEEMKKSLAIIQEILNDKRIKNDQRNNQTQRHIR